MRGNLEAAAGHTTWRRRRAIMPAATVAFVLAAALVFLVVQPAAGASGPARAGALYRVATNQKVVALTFDDGPDPRWTPRVLDLLAAHGDHATFFQIGTNALAHRDLVTRLLQSGNEIGNHTLAHPHLPTLSTARIRDEIRDGSNAVVEAGAPRPMMFRPPIGLTDGRVAAASAAQGLRTVFWGACVEHYVNHNDVAAGTRNLLAKVRPGMIILAHDGGIPDRTRTMQSLPMLLDELRRQGYRVVTVSELLAVGAGS